MEVEVWLLMYVLFGLPGHYSTGTIKLDSFEDCKASGDAILYSHREETKRDAYYICQELRGKPLNFSATRRRCSGVRL